MEGRDRNCQKKIYRCAPQIHEVSRTVNMGRVMDEILTSWNSQRAEGWFGRESPAEDQDKVLMSTHQHSSSKLMMSKVTTLDTEEEEGAACESGTVPSPLSPRPPTLTLKGEGTLEADTTFLNLRQHRAKNRVVSQVSITESSASALWKSDHVLPHQPHHPKGAHCHNLETRGSKCYWESNEHCNHALPSPLSCATTL